MALVEIDEGIYADSETGEIEGIPDGEPKLGFAARKGYQAQVQEKSWGRVAATMKAILVKEAETKRSVYRDVAVSIRQSKRWVLNLEMLRDELENGEFTKEELLELVLAAKDFDMERLEDGSPMRNLVQTFRKQVPTKSWAELDTVKQLAPGS